MKDWWKTSSVGLAGCLIAMIGFWLTSGANYVTRGDVSTMIAKESPYVVDQQLILQNLQSLNEKLARNNELINSLNIEIASLRTEINKD